MAPLRIGQWALTTPETARTTASEKPQPNVLSCDDLMDEMRSILEDTNASTVYVRYFSKLRDEMILSQHRMKAFMTAVVNIHTLPANHRQATVDNISQDGNPACDATPPLSCQGMAPLTAQYTTSISVTVQTVPQSQAALGAAVRRVPRHDKRATAQWQTLTLAAPLTVVEQMTPAPKSEETPSKLHD
ncbi:hypothetical protein TrVFT333_009506 [Trichoderma virens FT-333]|nr:hypothetical protein TrVFT333_009506 [Trichoderma virens FT-333]